MSEPDIYGRRSPPSQGSHLCMYKQLKTVGPAHTAVTAIAEYNQAVPLAVQAKLASPKPLPRPAPFPVVQHTHAPTRASPPTRTTTHAATHTPTHPYCRHMSRLNTAFSHVEVDASSLCHLARWQHTRHWKSNRSARRPCDGTGSVPACP